VQTSPANGLIDGFVAEVISATDYYAFGAPMPGRSYQASEYRFSFNGKEKDDEVKGEGGQQDYGMRIYDTRLGKFLSVDPISMQYPELTPYQFSSNAPIDGIDKDGLEHSFFMISLDSRKNIILINISELNAQYETIFGTVHSFNAENKAYLYSTDGHWHSMPEEWRNKSLSLAGDLNDVYSMANKWPLADKQYNIAHNIQALQVFSEKAQFTIGIVLLLEGATNVAAGLAKGISRKVGGYDNRGKVDTHLKSRNKQGYGFKDVPEMEQYGKDFFARTGDNIIEFTDNKGYIHRLDNATQEYGILMPNNNIQSVFKVIPSESTSYTDGISYMAKQMQDFGVKSN
ncbi:MAG: hypothetical protein CFE21_21940, partial [Bacteroidetes bacterium B1(2017)]